MGSWYLADRSFELASWQLKGGITLPFDGSLSPAERRMVDQRSVSGELQLFYSTLDPALLAPPVALVPRRRGAG